jgi:hypothetical protein
VIVDEAAIASLERVNALRKLAQSSGLRGLMLGDDFQANSIQFGDAFRPCVSTPVSMCRPWRRS